MDTSTSIPRSSDIRDWRVADLATSHLEEDKQLAQRVRSVMQTIISKLKPNLKYICASVSGWTDHPCRCVLLGTMEALGAETSFSEGSELYLLEDGTFALCTYDGSSTKIFTLDFKLLLHSYLKVISYWEYCQFEKIFNALQRIYKAAETKREEYLDSIRRSRIMLDNICDAMQVEKRESK